MKHIPFLIRIATFVTLCVFIAKWTHVTFSSLFMHFMFYIGCCVAYLVCVWVHLALEKLWYSRVPQKSSPASNEELEQ